MMVKDIYFSTLLFFESSFLNSPKNACRMVSFPLFVKAFFLLAID